MARLVFEGANLLDGTSPPQPDTTVVVEGNRVTGVLRNAAAERRPDDRVIDLAGRTLMPGLWSCHFHAVFRDCPAPHAPAGLEQTPPMLTLVAEQNLATAFACGVTSVVGASSPHYIDPALRDAIKLGMIQGPRVWAASHELCTSGDIPDPGNRLWHWELGNLGTMRVADGPEGFRRVVREEIARGADVVKVNASHGHAAWPADDSMASISPAELRAAAEAAHERGRKIRAHAASRRAILDAARAGFDIIDHADRVDAECIGAILEAGCAVAPSILYNQRLLELYENCDPRDPRNPMYFGPTESAAETETRVRGIREDFENACRMLPEMLAAGVRLVLGDDFGTVLLRHGEFGAEMEFYVKQVGIPVLDVIRWGTRNGASLVDAEDELGTVAPGKLADLLIVDGDPVADIACLGDPGRILAVIKDGILVRDELPAQNRRPM